MIWRGSYVGIVPQSALVLQVLNPVPTLSSSVPADRHPTIIVLNFVDAESGNITIKKTSNNSIFETIDV